MSGCRAPWSNTRPRTSLKNWKEREKQKEGRIEKWGGGKRWRGGRGTGKEKRGRRREMERGKKREWGRGREKEWRRKGRRQGGRSEEGRGKRYHDLYAHTKASTNFDLWPCICVCFVHHLHDLHHVQVNGFLGPLADSQHCIHYHLSYTNTLNLSQSATRSEMGKAMAYQVDGLSCSQTSSKILLWSYLGIRLVD